VGTYAAITLNGKDYGRHPGLDDSVPQ
jgi:hypothetical protein